MSEWSVWQVPLAADCAKAVPCKNFVLRRWLCLRQAFEVWRYSIVDYPDGNLTLSMGQGPTIVNGSVSNAGHASTCYTIS